MSSSTPSTIAGPIVTGTMPIRDTAGHARGTPSDGAPSSDTTGRPLSAVGRALVLLYGTSVYLAFLATFVYLIGFVAGVVVPKHIDSGTPGPVLTAALVDLGLLWLFAAQHTVMARKPFKRRLTRWIPAAAERSTFVLATVLVLGLMVWQWRPLPGTVWHLEGAAATAPWVVCGLGWALVLLSTFLIDHFELFGLRQVTMAARGRPIEPPAFKERWIYRHVRHPLMLGFLVAFWATPHMTTSHLFFAAVTTLYILCIGLVVEERDLVAEHGAAYEEYRRRVPKLIPRLRPAR